MKAQNKIFINALPLWLIQYYELTKPRVVSLIIFTAVVGMFLSTPGMVPLDTLLLGTLGIGLSAAAGAVVNQILDQQYDQVMARTKARPLPTGQVDTPRALVFALALTVISTIILVHWVNTLTAVLTFCSLIGYAVVYTVFLKHWTPQNIVIGGAAGAAPPVLGWAAVNGSINGDALLLFLIVFCWTPPHFWALALYRKQEYASAGIPMLPVTHGDKFTRLHIVLYTILLTAASIMPFATKMSGWIYLLGVILLNGRFLYYAMCLYRDYTDALAKRIFGFSIQYLAMLFALMLIDHYRAYYQTWLGMQ